MPSRAGICYKVTPFGLIVAECADCLDSVSCTPIPSSISPIDGPIDGPIGFYSFGRRPAYGLFARGVFARREEE